MGGIITFLGILFIIFSFILGTPMKNEKEVSSAIAINFVVYRNAVHNFIFANKDFKGSIADSQLLLPFAWQNHGWSALVSNETCYVFGNAKPEEMNAVKNILISKAIGIKKNGAFYPSLPLIPLPEVILENNIVSMVEVK